MSREIVAVEGYNKILPPFSSGLWTGNGRGYKIVLIKNKVFGFFLLPERPVKLRLPDNPQIDQNLIYKHNILRSVAVGM